MDEVCLDFALCHQSAVRDQAFAVRDGQVRCQLSGNRERKPTIGERVQDQRMMEADPTDLDSKRCASLRQTQVFDAELKQTWIPQPEVKTPPRDLCDMRDQPRHLHMLLIRETPGLVAEVRGREFANLFDDQRV
jgi:hypothetical protein